MFHRFYVIIIIVGLKFSHAISIDNTKPRKDIHGQFMDIHLIDIPFSLHDPLSQVCGSPNSVTPQIRKSKKKNCTVADFWISGIEEIRF